jgi:outer membrane biosynthesis protein TonB
MQFLPQTWASVARDGDGNGTKNPDDIDDSALGSAVYLCGAGGNLADRAGMARAAFRYNHSDYYVSLVLSMQAGFETGVFALPSPPPPANEKAKVGKAKTPKTKPTRPRDVTKKRAPKSKQHTANPTTAPKPTAAPRPKPKPAPKPAPKPKPKPSPTTPAAPKLVNVTGTWTACNGGYCLDGARLDLTKLGSSFNGQSLVGKTVTVQVEDKRRNVVHRVISAAPTQASPSLAP